MESDLILVLDCDGLIMNSVKMIEDFVAQVDYRCSKKYIECIRELSKKREAEIYRRYYWVDHEIYDRLIEQERALVDRYVKISRITFDEVLEEVFPLYEGKIDYDKIYQLSNAFVDVIDKIRELYFARKFRKIYVCTHCNSKKEIEAKGRFFKKYLPMVTVVYVPFHDIPYIYDSTRYFENRDRPRTNKPAYFFDVTEEDPTKTLFGDDSREICNEAEECGAHSFHRDRTSPDALHIFREIDKFLVQYESDRHIDYRDKVKTLGIKKDDDTK